MYSLVMGFKNNYRKYGYTTLYSLLKNNPDDRFVIYILSDDLDFQYFSPLEEQFGCKIVPVKISAESIKTVDCGYLSFATLIRLLIGKYLPEHVTKVLYIDADIIIDASLASLWTVDVEQYYAAVVRSSAPVAHLKKINVNAERYFNAGVMLLNLTRCRQDSIFERCLELIKNNKFQFLDQDALNIAIANNVEFIDAKWNFDSFRAKTLLLTNDLAHPRRDIAIYHYTGKDKPWMRYCFNQFKSVYLKYYCQDLGFELENDTSFLNGVRYRLISFLYSNKLTRKIIFHIRSVIRTNIE
ncbi:glycosyltransferase family 8 protein [Franconibacter helveticus]|uniref:glycosyltransferase family 8 protein n=1 Tax=Franconibacter helveticus TaxID=357240 RepID=UPI000DA1CE25|nr:glycosyltransferase family 8 protein [Franconibacter helveticus]